MITRILIIFFLLLAALLVLWQSMVFPVDQNSKEIVVFNVEKGEGAFEIAANLEKEKLIKNRLFFDAAVILLNGIKRLQAGDYYLSANMAPLEIARKIINGETVKETLTIPEGWNLTEINVYLENKGVFGKEEFLAATDRNFSQKFPFLKDKPENAGLEGYLFPDTYEIKKGERAEILVGQMLANFDQKLTPELRAEMKEQEKTIFDIVVMASLLEKEVKTLEEKKLASGILWKRLGIGMRLQVDSTAAYGSFYDTYRYAGLPPGPIANPGLDSILAAIYPQKSDGWYYLSTPEGETLFSRTLEEHNVKKVKYLK